MKKTINNINKNFRSQEKSMSGILAVLIQALPTLLPMIIALFNKSKPDRIAYFEALKKAALHDNKAMLAFAADSALCWVKDASEDEWQETGDALKSFCGAAAEFSKIQAAKRAGGTVA